MSSNVCRNMDPIRNLLMLFDFFHINLTSYCFNRKNFQELQINILHFILFDIRSLYSLV